MYIFWKAGEFNGITVSDRVILIQCGDDMVVDDPTQRLEFVMINGKKYELNLPQISRYNYVRGI